MPNLSTARRISSLRSNDAKTIGEITKENSDFLMEQTFDHDIQAKKCYIYEETVCTGASVKYLFNSSISTSLNTAGLPQVDLTPGFE